LRLAANKLKRNRQEKPAASFYFKSVGLKPSVSQLAVLFQQFEWHGNARNCKKDGLYSYVTWRWDI
jgi:hypothetical protein